LFTTFDHRMFTLCAAPEDLFADANQQGRYQRGLASRRMRETGNAGNAAGFCPARIRS
jgi:hypothetical protein